MMRYHIETFSLADGWVNTWAEPVEGRDDTYLKRPVTFATYLEAIAALNEYWADLQDAVALGDIRPYDLDDFRVAQIELKGQDLQTPQPVHAYDRARLS